MNAAELFVNCLENEGVEVVSATRENVDIMDARLGSGLNSSPHDTKTRFLAQIWAASCC
jgi:thiamine pyrophosphate-dependent acetolactate synthase large subunit-like protein